MTKKDSYAFILSFDFDQTRNVVTFFGLRAGHETA